MSGEAEEPNTPLSSFSPLDLRATPFLSLPTHIPITTSSSFSPSSTPRHLSVNMWWYHNCSENRDSHIIHHSANAWGAKSSTGNRWNEDKNRVVSDIFDPHRTVGPRPPLPSFVTPEMDEPAKPHPVRIEPVARHAMLRRNRTQMGNCAPTVENRALWAQMEISLCGIGQSLQGPIPGATQCRRPSIDTGAFCDVHSCIAYTPDGWRCPNSVDFPAQSRFCSSGYHAETDREDHLLSAIQHRKAELEAEQAQRDADLEEMLRAAAFPEINLADYYHTPDITPEMVVRSLDDSEASTSSANIRTPTSDTVDLVASVEAWWQGTRTVPTVTFRTVPEPPVSEGSIEVEVEAEVDTPTDVEVQPGHDITPASLPITIIIPRKDSGLGLNFDMPAHAGPSNYMPTIFEKSCTSLSTSTSGSFPNTERRESDTVVLRGFPVGPSGSGEGEEEGKAKYSPMGRGDGKKYAQLMKDRFGNGFVRRQAWGRNSIT